MDKKTRHILLIAGLVLIALLIASFAIRGQLFSVSKLVAPTGHTTTTHATPTIVHATTTVRPTTTIKSR